MEKMEVFNLLNHQLRTVGNDFTVIENGTGTMLVQGTKPKDSMKAVEMAVAILAAASYVNSPATYGYAFNSFGNQVHALAEKNGFWEGDLTPDKISSKLALIHGEVSEALEVSRKDMEEPSPKLENVSHFAEELADVIIRALDLATHLKLDIGQALVAKHLYNINRPFKHGKKF